MRLRIALYVAAAALFGAHFLRSGNIAATALCLLLPLLFFWRRRWILVLLQAMAYGAAAAWLYVAKQLVELRWQMGRPWLAAAVILGTVALFTLLAGLLLNSRVVRAHYPARRGLDADRAR